MALKGKVSQLGCGGDKVVSMLTFYYDDPSSNPAEAYSFFCKNLLEKKQIRGQGWLMSKYYPTEIF